MQKESLIVPVQRGLQRRDKNMVFKHRTLAFILLLMMLFSGVVSGQEIQGMAIIANNPTALGITGHVAFAYQNPLTGLFVFGSVGMDLTKATNLIDPKDLDINTEYTFDELKVLLTNKGYTSYKAFYTDTPNFNAATTAESDLTTANYNLFASTTKPITDPFSRAVGADDENCLTGTKKVLEAYGVDLPDWDESILGTVSVVSLPNVWYLSLNGKIYYPDFLGPDPVVPTGYKKSTASAALDALKIRFPLLPSPTSDTSSSESNKASYVPPTTTKTTVSYSYNVPGEWTFYSDANGPQDEPITYTLASDGYVKYYDESSWYTGWVPFGEWSQNGNQIDWVDGKSYIGPWGEVVGSGNIQHFYGTIDENGILRMSNWFSNAGASAEKVEGNAVTTTSVPARVAGVGLLIDEDQNGEGSW
jgi:hypothetical protein